MRWNTEQVLKTSVIKRCTASLFTFTLVCLQSQGNSVLSRVLPCTEVTASSQHAEISFYNNNASSLSWYELKINPISSFYFYSLQFNTLSPCAFYSLHFQSTYWWELLFIFILGRNGVCWLHLQPSPWIFLFSRFVAVLLLLYQPKCW